MEETSIRSEFLRITRQWLDREPAESFPKAQHEQYLFSKYHRCLESLCADAQRIACEQSLEFDDFEYGYLDRIGRFMQDWLAALYDWDKFDPRLWWHRKDPVSDVKSNSAPEFSKSDIEFLGTTYLALPVRSQLVERNLIDCMIAMEYYGFCREIYGQKYISRVGFVRGNGPVGFVIWRLASLLMYTVLFLPFMLLSYMDVISDDVLMAVGFTLLGLFVLESAWAVIRFPQAWRGQIQMNKKLVKILSQMNFIYNQLESNGPISATYFRECLIKSSDEGVSWPSPVYAIIDDILKRDGYF